ncbi:MAG: Xaa-Pro peptidase family protein [candidate division Zixibacteria bacterium]
MDIIKSKIQQVPRLLEELDIDLWMVFVRETAVTNDPVMSLVVGYEVVWPSFFLYTCSGETIAIIGSIDQADFQRSGYFTEIIPYDEGVADVIKETLTKLNPKSIAINYSKDNPSADGLTHGMYHLLRDYLVGTQFIDKLISAEEICSKLRSRKSDVEIENISKAAELACQAWDNVIPQLKTGMTEKEVSDLVASEIESLGYTISFPTIVNTGDKTLPGHGTPTDAVIEPGEILHIDFGVNYKGYCSDLQRLVYFKKPEESDVPDEVLKVFELIKNIILESAKMCKPGKIGLTIDSYARKVLKDNGYPEYKHALGHQLGQYVHDGGALIGPQWERYGKSPNIPLEIGNVFTLELEVTLENIGHISLEEDVVIENQGARFLSPRQTELVVL